MLSSPQAPNSKSVFIFIGPKGSGKSFLGGLLQEHFKIPFLPVEEHIKKQDIKKDRAVNNEAYIQQVFSFIEELVRKEICKEDFGLSFESTGLTDCFDSMLESLKKDFRVVTVRVKADPNTCLQRFRSRDQSLHIPISEEQIKMINEKVAEKTTECEFEIDNKGSNSKEALVNELSGILAKLSV
ncbi:expressed unknown protein [Seminavis robusta]|uniref:Shikimate kinase n=1 Tax=Seminavis robusta TaxID=568900 RepID=A0A9N8DD43_9STRA|nr:expressed unknown protein [Seminavis robusta]|eukprot:Sro64_g036410.1 n/a (184) ;mRNA; r:104453-105004